MVILRSQDKITDFLMILAWASPFILQQKMISHSGTNSSRPTFPLSISCYFGFGRGSGSLFRQVVIPTARYSDRSLFRQVDIPTNRSLFRQVAIPTGRYSDRSLFRKVDIPTNRSLFRHVDSPTNRSLFLQVDSPTNRVDIPKGLYSDRSLFRHKNNSDERTNHY